MSSTEHDLAALYARYKDAMHRMAASVLRDSGLAAEASDAVHEVMLSLMESPPATPVRNWESFLVQAVKYRALDRVKTAYVRHHGGSLEPAVHDSSDGTDLAQEVADDVDRMIDAASVQDALATLTAQEQEVVWRVYGLEESQRDLAREISLSPGRVSQVCKSGLEKLKTQMKNVRTNF